MRVIIGGIADRIGASFSPNAIPLSLKHDADEIFGLKVENYFSRNDYTEDEWKVVVSEPRLTCYDRLF